MVRMVLELVPTLGGKMSSGSIFQEVAGRPGYGFPKQSHLSEMGFIEQLPGHELMGSISTVGLKDSGPNMAP